MDLDLDEQEFEIADNADNQFDDLAGVLQDILISQQFEEISNDFVKHNCTVFEESQDNKPEYMIIFKQYKAQMEKFIEKELQQKGFEMKVLLENFKDLHLDECIMETLSSLTDYELFKDIMVEAKVRVEEEQRTIKQSTNKATKGYKQAPSQNIFSVPSTMQKQNKSTKPEDLRADLFFKVVPLNSSKKKPN